MEDKQTMKLKKELEAADLQENKRRKHRRIIRKIITTFFVVIIIFSIIVGGLAILMAIGKKRLNLNLKPNLQSAQTTNMAEETTEETQTYWEEGWVRYEDKVYQYNEDILTFMVLGIDKLGTVKKNPDEVSGGQADAIFLIVVNPDDKAISIIAINRDTMTDVLMYGYQGTNEFNATTIQAQIATQHGFGDGMEKSCELTENAVSKLLFDLPIHGYVSINMGAIPKLNDAIGGVDLVAYEDIEYPQENVSWKKDDKITLLGMDAFWYVRYRDISVFESNKNRLSRQKQYISLFVKKAISETQKNITLPITLYKELSQYMVTDISIDEMSYLVGSLIDYHFDADAIYSLEGTTKMGEKHEEFYLDKEAVRNLMIRLFYREVDPQTP